MISEGGRAANAIAPRPILDCATDLTNVRNIDTANVASSNGRRTQLQYCCLADELWFLRNTYLHLYAWKINVCRIENIEVEILFKLVFIGSDIFIYVSLRCLTLY